MYNTKTYVYILNKNHYVKLTEAPGIDIYPSVEQCEHIDINEYFNQNKYCVIPSEFVGTYDNLIYIHFAGTLYVANTNSNTIGIQYINVLNTFFLNNGIALITNCPDRHDKIVIFDPVAQSEKFSGYLKNHNFGRN